MSPRSFKARHLLLGLGLSATLLALILEAPFLLVLDGIISPALRGQTLIASRPHFELTKHVPKPVLDAQAALETLNEGWAQLNTEVHEKAMGENADQDLNESFRDKYLRAREARMKDYDALFGKAIKILEDCAAKNPENGFLEFKIAQCEISQSLLPNCSDVSYYAQNYKPMLCWAPSFWGQEIKVRDQDLFARGLDRWQRAMAQAQFKTHAQGITERVLESTQGQSLLQQILTQNHCARNLRNVGVSVAFCDTYFDLEGLPVSPNVDFKDRQRLAKLLKKTVQRLAQGQSRRDLSSAIDAKFLSLRAERHLAVAQRDHSLIEQANEQFGDFCQQRLMVYKSEPHREPTAYLDEMATPYGGWSKYFRPELGQRLENCAYESLSLWLVTATVLMALLVNALISKFSATEQPARVSWTFGDLLQIILPGFGLCLALTIAFLRFHPVSRLGYLLEARVLQAAQCGVFVFSGAMLSMLEWHRLARLKRGLSEGIFHKWQVMAWAGLVFLFSSWISPKTLERLPLFLVPLAGVTLLSLVTLSGLDQAKQDRKALFQATAQVSVALFGLILLFTASLQLFVIRPHRLGLMKAYAAQQKRLLLRSAEAWESDDFQEKLQKTKD